MRPSAERHSVSGHRHCCPPVGCASRRRRAAVQAARSQTRCTGCPGAEPAPETGLHAVRRTELASSSPDRGSGCHQDDMARAGPDAIRVPGRLPPADDVFGGSAAAIGTEPLSKVLEGSVRLGLLDYLNTGGKRVRLHHGVEQRCPGSGRYANCFGLDQPDLDATLRIDLSNVVEVLGQRAEFVAVPSATTISPRACLATAYARPRVRWS